MILQKQLKSIPPSIFTSSFNLIPALGNDYPISVFNALANSLSVVMRNKKEGQRL